MFKLVLLYHICIFNQNTSVRFHFYRDSGKVRFELSEKQFFIIEMDLSDIKGNITLQIEE